MKDERDLAFDEKIIAFALDTVNKNRDDENHEMARRLLEEFYDLDGVLSASYDRIEAVCGSKLAPYIFMQRDIRRGIYTDYSGNKEIIKSSEDAARFAVKNLYNDNAERMYVVYLKDNGEVSSYQCFGAPEPDRDQRSCGSRASTPVLYSVIMSRIIEHDPHSVFVSHNHPSASAVPSEADLRANYRLRKCIEFLKIGFLDHVVTGKNNTYCLISEYEKSGTGTVGRIKKTADEVGG